MSDLKESAYECFYVCMYVCIILFLYLSWSLRNNLIQGILSLHRLKGGNVIQDRGDNNWILRDILTVSLCTGFLFLRNANVILYDVTFGIIFSLIPVSRSAQNMIFNPDAVRVCDLYVWSSGKPDVNPPWYCWLLVIEPQPYVHKVIIKCNIHMILLIQLSWFNWPQLSSP